MTLPFWCLFAAALLVVLSKVPMTVVGQRQEAYDNHHPRLQQARLSGIGHRAWAAHQNMIEAFPLFAAAVLVSHLGSGQTQAAALLSVAFILLRLCYQLFYLIDWDRARSMSWGLGFACVLGLFLTPVMR